MRNTSEKSERDGLSASAITVQWDLVIHGESELLPTAAVMFYVVSAGYLWLAICKFPGLHHVAAINH